MVTVILRVLSVYGVAFGGLILIALFANGMYDMMLLVAFIMSLVCIVALLVRLDREQKYASSLYDELFELKYGGKSQSGSAKSSKVVLKKK